jgi:hypothetical protein
MLNLSAGEGRDTDTSALGTPRIDWSRPLVGAIPHALQNGNRAGFWVDGVRCYSAPA